MIQEGISLVFSGYVTLASLALRGEMKDDTACFAESGSDSVGSWNSSFGSGYQSARFADTVFM